MRANYADYAKGVKRDWSYLEDFFRNLLLGEKNEMKSRYLLIGLTDEDKQKIRELSESGGEANCGRIRVKSGQKKVVRKRLSVLLILLEICQELRNRIWLVFLVSTDLPYKNIFRI